LGDDVLKRILLVAFAVCFLFVVAFAAPTNVSLSGYPLLLSFLSQFDRGDGNYFIPYDFNNNDLASRFLLQSQDSDLYRVIRFYPENPEMFEVCFIPRPSDQILINFVSHKYSSDTSTYYGFYRSATVVYYSVSVYKFTYNAENGFFVNSMSSLPAMQYLDVYSTSKKIISFIPNDMVTIFTSKIPSSVPNLSDISSINFIDAAEYEPPIIGHTLTINYLYADDNPAADPVTQTIAAGETYSVPSMEIEGYTPSIPVVSGIMPEEDLTVNVYYSKAFYDLKVKYSTRTAPRQPRRSLSSTPPGLSTTSPPRQSPATVRTSSLYPGRCQGRL